MLHFVLPSVAEYFLPPGFCFHWALWSGSKEAAQQFSVYATFLNSLLVLIGFFSHNKLTHGGGFRFVRYLDLINSVLKLTTFFVFISKKEHNFFPLHVECSKYSAFKEFLKLDFGFFTYFICTLPSSSFLCQSTLMKVPFPLIWLIFSLLSSFVVDSQNSFCL